jgi:hypothetical protein
VAEDARRQSNVTDTIDIWSEMSEVDKFESRQFFDGLLNDLKSVGYTLYMAQGHSVYFLGADPASRVALKTLMLMARRLNDRQRGQGQRQHCQTEQVTLFS